MKCPFVDKSFVNVVQKAFNEGEELAFTLIQPMPTDATSLVPLIEPSFDKVPVAQLND